LLPDELGSASNDGRGDRDEKPQTKKAIQLSTKYSQKACLIRVYEIFGYIYSVKQDENIEPDIPFTKEQFILLQRENQKLKEENKNARADLLYLKNEISQLKRMIFGSKSERYVPEDSGQGLLFEDFTPETKMQEDNQQINYTRKKNKKLDKKGHSRMPLPSHLPREEIFIEPDNIPEEYREIGRVETEVLDYIPARLHVKKYVRKKYAGSNGDGVVIADLPTFPIPRGNAGSGLLSHLIISKFVDHLPLYRQVQQFKREGVVLSESTINDWISAISRLVTPLYDTLKDKILSADYLMADETPVPVLTSQKPGATHKGYHWVYYSPLDKIVCFDYRKSRSRDGPKSFLEGFNGSLQTDGYAAYEKLDKVGDIKLISCWAHARRKFEQALESDPDRAARVMKKIQALYEVERYARENSLGYDQRMDLRRERSVPILTELRTMLDNMLPEVLPKSSIGKAVTYTLGLWDRLNVFLEDGRYEIDNNLVENSIRPVALGRKNYLFAGSHNGARNAAMLYSFVYTCKINEVNPFEWLRDVLNIIPDHPANRLEELLPNNWKNR